MQHVLRAISGPHAGAVYVLGSRTTIGRASDCDIQILHEGVSRHHAKITLEDDGSLVVADLSSDNGTFIEDERVERHVLAAGEVIRVMRSRFAYEVDPTDDVQTSVMFHRKVTSGDSLRQTVHHDKPLAATRAGLAQGGPGGLAGDRGRPYSRPQAAAPALSGARPGAAAARPGGAEALPPERSEIVDETPRVRRPTPPQGTESSASVRERRPRVAAATLSAQESRPGPSRTVTRPPEPPEAEEPRPSEPDHAAAASLASRGSYVALGQGRRERVTLMPGSGVPASVAPTPRVDRPMAPSSEPAGRMAPLAPSGVEPEPRPHGPGAAGAQAPLHATGPMGSGWVRVTRPLEPPGSMRPGTTLTGVPRVGTDAESPLVRTTAGEPLERGPKHETAEYGAVGERQTTERGLPPRATLSAPVVASTPEPAAEPEPEPASEPEPELDAMTTVPALRRRGPKRSSATPTEEVPRVRTRAVDPLDDDSHVKTQPRVTLVPRERGPADPPIVVKPRPAPAVEPDAASSRRAAGSPDAAGSPARVSEPSPPASPPDAASPPGASTLDATLARRLTTTGGSRSRARSIAYEDTLRFQRPEPAPASSPPPPDVPQARPHATTAEVISALESLLPPDDVAVGPLPNEQRPDARTHAPGLDVSTSVDVLLDAAVTDLAWAPEVAELSDLDKVELRAQQVLEDADREHKRREGLERLVDILEYRELRLRALQSAAGGAAAAERCAVLEQALQQRAPAGDDMSAMRRYHRFVCSIPAQLTHLPRGAKSNATVEIEDLSAGGARITFGEYSIGAGETVWLTIELAQADRSRIPDPTASTVVMKARVVWSRPHEATLGLVFAGAPQYGP